jgi:hypothetical protein
VENIAANFVSSGKQDDKLQELRKPADTDNAGYEPSPPKKKDKTTSQPQLSNNSTSAMIVSSSNQASQPQVWKPQLCRHCEKLVIHTNSIGDVYNVPSAKMASSGIRDTPNMSVVFQNMGFGMNNDNYEYLFVNDFSDLDHLTLKRFMQHVPVPISTCPVYDINDDDLPLVQASDHLFLPRFTTLTSTFIAPHLLLYTYPTSSIAHVSRNYSTVYAWKSRMWMHHRYVMAHTNIRVQCLQIDLTVNTDLLTSNRGRHLC